MRRSTWPNKGFLLVTMHAPPAFEEEFNAWYDSEHLPERLRVPGFESARRFVCLSGHPRYLAMYDLARPEVLDSPEYLKVAFENSSPWTLRVLQRVRVYRAAGRQIYPGTAVTGASSRVQLLRFRNRPAERGRRDRPRHALQLRGTGRNRASARAGVRGSRQHRLSRLRRAARARRVRARAQSIRFARRRHRPRSTRTLPTDDIDMTPAETEDTKWLVTGTAVRLAHRQVAVQARLARAATGRNHRARPADRRCASSFLAPRRHSVFASRAACRYRNRAQHRCDRVHGMQGDVPQGRHARDAAGRRSRVRERHRRDERERAYSARPAWPRGSSATRTSAWAAPCARCWKPRSRWAAAASAACATSPPGTRSPKRADRLSVRRPMCSRAPSFREGLRCLTSLGPHLRCLDVSHATRRADRPRARSAGGHIHPQPRRRSDRYRPLRRQARRDLHRVAQLHSRAGATARTPTSSSAGWACVCSASTCTKARFRHRRSSSPTHGGRTSRRASKRSAPSARCSRATFRSTREAAAIRRFGMRSSGSRPALRCREASAVQRNRRSHLSAQRLRGRKPHDAAVGRYGSLGRSGRCLSARGGARLLNDSDIMSLIRDNRPSIRRRYCNRQDDLERPSHRARQLPPGVCTSHPDASPKCPPWRQLSSCR